MNKTHTVQATQAGIVALAALVTTALVGVATASADAGYGFGNRAQSCDGEQREAVEQAIEDGDYDTWASLMDGRGRISDVVTEENFDTFAAMHEAMERGDLEEAAEYREELGLGLRPQDGTGHRGQMGGRGGMHRGAGSGDGVNNRWTSAS